VSILANPRLSIQMRYYFPEQTRHAQRNRLSKQMRRETAHCPHHRQSCPLHLFGSQPWKKLSISGHDRLFCTSILFFMALLCAFGFPHWQWLESSVTYGSLSSWVSCWARIRLGRDPLLLADDLIGGRHARSLFRHCRRRYPQPFYVGSILGFFAACVRVAGWIQGYSRFCRSDHVDTVR